MILINAFVTYETPQFPCGGIAAVLGKLPAVMKELSASSAIVITPHHVSPSDNNKIGSLTLIPVGNATVHYRHFTVPCSARRLDGVVPTYFVGLEAPPPNEGPVFAGSRHPYDVDAVTLLRDSLLFGAIVAELLPSIGADVARASGITEPDTAIDWRLVMQDWEAATVALVVAERSLRASLFLVLHNSYDSFAPATDEIDEGGAVRPGLDRIGLSAQHPANQTILERVLPLVEQPVFTVSAQFAHEFTGDPLQVEVMAPHLQALLAKHPVVGVDNGPFAKLEVPSEVTRAASDGNVARLMKWKAANRTKALAALAKHIPTAEKPVWGDRAKFRLGTGPWLVMAGRDDPRQKGYDVAAVAVDAYLERHGHDENCAQFVFFPIPGDEDKLGLQFLKDLADRRPASVLVLPFRWSEGYLSTLQASFFGLMPSLYEPFGMANEFYLAGGCVGIGRATGGNVEQIVPLWATRSCNDAVRVRAGRFHSMSSMPTGLLFREPDDPKSSRDWHAINAAKYSVGSPTRGRVQERLEHDVFRSMAAELLWAMEDGVRILASEPALYGRMMAAGIGYISRTFSWFRAAQEYARFVDHIA